jgi:hypothetical protein
MKIKSSILVAILFLASCNNGGGGQPSHRQAKTKLEIDIDALIEGQYLAIFETINPQITSKISGAFTFSVDKFSDELVGDVRITNAGTDLVHAQAIRVGNRCPTLDDDLNQDGIVDDKEGEAVYGKVFFPLDGDLTTQSSHDGEFPKGDIYGNYIYSRVTKFSDFMKDLRDSENNEGYIKLKAKEPLNIEGRVVVIHGVDEASGLPETVRSVSRTSPHQSLPIVCGLIKKVLIPPGQIDDGTLNN